MDIYSQVSSASTKEALKPDVLCSPSETGVRFVRFVGAGCDICATSPGSGRAMPGRHLRGTAFGVWSKEFARAFVAELSRVRY
jgi:hypothetical protein